MDYRIANLKLEEAVAADKTITIELDSIDIISRLQVKLDTLSVTPTFIAPIVDVLSKMEIVDGSDVLYSLDGEEAQMVNFFNRGKSPYNYLSAGDAKRSIAEVGIDFGVNLWDEELAFDPSKFSNPQLKLTIDVDAFDSSGADTKVTVDAFIFDEKVVTPEGFLMTKDIYQYTAVQSGYTYIEFPQDYVIRQVFYGNGYAGKNLRDQVDNVKLSTDNDKHVIYDRAIRDLLDVIHPMYGRCEEAVMMYALGAAGADDVYLMPTARGRAMGQCQGNIACAHHLVQLSYTKWQAYQELAACGAEYLCTGYDPYGFMPILFQQQMDSDKWFDPASVKKTELRINPDSSASTSATAKTVVQQLRPY